jgi:DNA-binding SARP family transcriptional activator
MTPEEAAELLLILDAADRWIAEFNEYCNPDDFNEGYPEKIQRTSYLSYRWRQRVEHYANLAPAVAG